MAPVTPILGAGNHAGLAAAGKPKDYFDDGLAQQVADFQREHRLHADGMAGVQTQIALDALVNHGGPVLRDTVGG